MLREGFDHGFAQSDWDAAKDETRHMMIECARSRRMIPYSDPFGGLPASVFRRTTRGCRTFLERLRPKKMSEAGPPLTVVAVHKSGNVQPGPGFFELAQSRGRNTSNIVECWVGEFKKVFAYWTESLVERRCYFWEKLPLPRPRRCRDRRPT
jgi:hypothetical protein